jgi:hypothetical protein
MSEAKSGTDVSSASRFPHFAALMRVTGKRGYLDLRCTDRMFSVPCS